MTQCQASIQANTKVLNDSFNKLFNYMQYQYIGNARVLKKTLVDSCANSSCIIAAKNLLSSVSGDSSAICDVLSFLKKGDSKVNFKAGWSDLITSIEGSMIFMSSLGVAL